MRRTTPNVLGLFSPRGLGLGLGLWALAGLLACGGGHSPTAASDAPAAPAGLAYTPPSSSGYRLVADPSSTPTKLVLNLMGPAGASVRGVNLNATCDGAKVAWAAPDGSATLAKPGAALDLGMGLPLLQSSASLHEMQVAIFQKGNTAAAILNDKPLFSVALALKPGAPKGPVALAMLPGSQVTDAAGNRSRIQVAIGSVVVN